MRATREKDLARYWSKVDESGDCWVWTGFIMPNGYGQFSLGLKHVYAHRATFILLEEMKLSPEMQVDHLCHNRACVRREHLRVVDGHTNQRNRRGANRNNAAGIRGVCWHKGANKWVANASFEGRTVYGGLHLTKEDAGRAAADLRRSLYGEGL